MHIHIHVYYLSLSIYIYIYTHIHIHVYMLCEGPHPARAPVGPRPRHLPLLEGADRIRLFICFLLLKQHKHIIVLLLLYFYVFYVLLLFMGLYLVCFDLNEHCSYS